MAGGIFFGKHPAKEELLYCVLAAKSGLTYSSHTHKKKKNSQCFVLNLCVECGLFIDTLIHLFYSNTENKQP